MAFVVEFIPDEAKERFKFSSLDYPRIGMPDAHKWVIDKDRDIFLIAAGNVVGGGEPLPWEAFILWWGGTFVYAELKYKVTGDVKTRDQDITWSLRQLSLPPELGSKRSEIVASLKEALDAYGYLHRRDFFRDVKFEF